MSPARQEYGANVEDAVASIDLKCLLVRDHVQADARIDTPERKHGGFAIILVAAGV